MHAETLPLECATRLSDFGVTTVARVLDRGATDLAIVLSSSDIAIVRCVERLREADCAALETMVAEGDFVWAGLVYGERAGSQTEGPIETFHISELDRLVARLLEVREALGEAG